MTVVPVKATTSTSSRRVVGDVWPIGVEVRDLNWNTTTPTVTVTLPDDTTTTVPVQAIGGCLYRAAYTLTVPGRHLAAVVAAGIGRADFAIQAVAPSPAGALPQLADANTYLGAHSWTDDDVQEALDAETDAQADICVIPAAYPKSMRNALLRRVARNLAMHRIPLAVLQGDAEAGTSNVLPTWDPEISRLEKPYRRLLVG